MPASAPRSASCSAGLDLAAETKAFYRRFFDHELADTEISEILSGTL